MSKKADKKVLAEEFHEQGLLAEDEGNRCGAMKFFNKAIINDPDNPKYRETMKRMIASNDGTSCDI